MTALAALVARDDRIVLDTGASIEELTALEIFKVAVRGADTLRGFGLPPVRDTCPNIRFHEQPELVGLQLVGGESLLARPAIEIKGKWTGVELHGDHVLLGGHWYPIERETKTAVEFWLKEHCTDGRITPDAYIGLYAAEGPPFALDDQVDDESVIQLTAGEAVDLGLKATLYEYQEVGVGWLRARADHGIGGILGDEMGLGKTLQLIGLLADRLQQGQGPSLVVVPLTLMENWRREFAKFAPGIGVYRHQGADRSRRPVVLAQQQVVLTTYDVAVLDEPVLSLVSWDTVVLDEAQAIKNPETQRAKAVKGLQRSCGFVSTGTPLENRTQDVWSLADFAVPGYLGSRADFATRLEEDPTGLRHALRPVMLRREVASVASDLPERIDVDVALEMLGPEGAGYDALIDSVASGSGAAALALITKLRQYTAHPDAIDGPRPHPAQRSAKLARLLEIAEEIVLDGAKAIVFAAFHDVADLIRDTLAATYGVAVWTIDGRTPVADRQRIIDQFGAVAGSAFLVLNPAAAGVGLNIQAASHVIHYTLEWNPAREAQATARAWRRGQLVPVTVHRLFYTGTIDEAIVERLQLKKDLFDEVITETREEDKTLKALLERAIAISPHRDRSIS